MKPFWIWPFRTSLNHIREHGTWDVAAWSDAQSAANDHAQGVISDLDYTERKPEWVMLRKQVAVGQIVPKHLRRLRNEDLEYLAGMVEVSPVVLSRLNAERAKPNNDDEIKKAEERIGEEIKVTENAIRATRVLERRATRRTQFTVAVLAAAVAVVIAFLGPARDDEDDPAPTSDAPASSVTSTSTTSALTPTTTLP